VTLVTATDASRAFEERLREVQHGRVVVDV